MVKQIAAVMLLVLVVCLLATHSTCDSHGGTLDKVVHQLMLESFYRREQVRSEGSSGIKVVRHQRDGTRTYYSDTHTGSGVASIHDHSDTIRSMGMGEVVAVLNGVEFTTRHNDYLLNTPSRSSDQYHKVEEVPFPEVPPDVLKKSSVKDQISEMKEYFRAWKLQDTSIRDYRPYFKPILSYLEGAWTYTSEDLDEPYPGERHQVDAKTWKELEEKVRFSSYAGTKDSLENFATLPRDLVMEGGELKVSQWNYRIMCHELKDDLGIDRLRVVDDLASRMAVGLSLEDFAKTREARFQLKPTDSGSEVEEGRYEYRLIDKLMSEIPGKDNYQADLFDESFGLTALEPNTSESVRNKQNVGFYHHISKYDHTDAMGVGNRHRGFSDPGIFMARNTQEKVVGRTINNCYWEWMDKPGCEEFTQKWSYAIPMEIIYLTPLAKWNPYYVEYRGWAATDSGKLVTANGEDGTYDKPYNGINSVRYFQTPAEFFDDEEYTSREADTTGSYVYVLDKEGNKRKVRASGHRIFIPSIDGVGVLRQRYPVMSVYGEGSTVWKELDALKDLLMNADKLSHMFSGSGGSFQSGIGDQQNGNKERFYLSPAAAKYYHHKHTVTLTDGEKKKLVDGNSITKTSQMANGHTHELVLVAESYQGRAHKIKVITCDQLDSCKDGHGKYLLGGFTNEWKYVDDVGKYLDDLKKVKSHTTCVQATVGIVGLMLLVVHMM